MSTNNKGDSSNINLHTTSELTRDEVLALWQKALLESDIENYLEHYKNEKKFGIFYTRIETNFPALGEALSDENESHVEGILLLGNEALRDIKINSHARPKRGYIMFSDNPRLKGLALQIQSEEERKRADAKSAAIAKRTDKETPTLEEVLEMEEYDGEGRISNILVTERVFNGAPRFFYLEVRLENGEITTELTHSGAIPIQTAPSLDFCTRDYNSLNEIYIELRKEITAYIAFPTDSLAPDLIALGSVATYFRELFYTFPFFDFTSSEPESGKTTAMKVQTFTSYYGTIASSVTEALLFREINDSHCFYGLDNIERFFVSPKDYSSIIDWLLSSHSRDIPCKRLEKTEEGYEVRYFDGYGMKAFTHIMDFPFALRALRSRCIQIVMQNGKPAKFYPSADKFTEIRDTLYKVRLYEFDTVKECYEKLIDSNALNGRTGDLYYPLLSIAKLVDEKVFQRVLRYATTDETERKELDSWNMMLIKVLLDNKLFGSHSTKEIRGIFEEALIDEGLLKDSTLATRTVTARLKKLGFIREDKKTDHKTWYLIDREKLMSKAYDYDIINEDEIEKSTNTHSTPKGNLGTFVTSDSGENAPQKGSIGSGEEDKPRTDEMEPDVHEDCEELTKVTKVPKRGVCESTKNVCDGCGVNAQTTEYNGEWLCSKCLTEFSDNLKECNTTRPEASDEDFQTRQDRAARDRLGVAKNE